MKRESIWYGQNIAFRDKNLKPVIAMAVEPSEEDIESMKECGMQDTHIVIQLPSKERVFKILKT